MSEFDIDYYEVGRTLFEEGQYEEALRHFIRSYEQGIDRQEILADIYACYVNPNEGEFRENYAKNSKEICNVPYEELTLDFIPVSDIRYYIFDRERSTFCGLFDLEKELSLPEEIELDSLLVADLWDFRRVLEFLTAKRWSTVYFVLNEQKARFASFLKLSGFTEIYLNNAVVFESTDIMRTFFESYPQFYLPRQVLAPQSDPYVELMNQIHDKRILSTDKRDNVLLSICIPSYNRGSAALRSVKNILSSWYDTEIEVVVSNNGSVAGTEDYKQIEELQDSRVTYFAFDENQGFASNVCNVLKHAHGRFAMLASDEDQLAVERLEAYMRFLLNHANAGFIMCSGTGANFVQFQEEAYEAGYEAICRALNSNYITGGTIHTDYMRQTGVLERFEEMRGNLYLEYYAHCVIALLIAQKLPAYTSDIVLWSAGRPAEPENDEQLLAYMYPENRMEQLNTSIEILGKCNLNEKIFSALVESRIEKTYYLVWLAYEERNKAFVEEFTWREALLLLHQNNRRLIETWKEHFISGDTMKKLAEKLFFKYLLMDDIYEFYDEEEKQKLKLANQLAQDINSAGVKIADIHFEELDMLAEKVFAQWKK